MIVDERGTKAPGSEAAPPSSVVDKRVTKTVIRRRAGATPPAPLPEEIAAKEVTPPKVEMEMPPEPPAKEEAKPVPMETLSSPPENSADAGYLPKYKRIKVVSTSETETVAGPEVVRPAPPKSPTAPGSVLSAPGSIGLGRREIIEIRDFSKPKMGKKKRLAPGKKSKKTEITTPRAAKRVIRVTDAVTVSELAKRMAVKVNEVIGKLMTMGTMVTINQQLDLDTATLVASEFGYEIENVAVAPEDLLQEEAKSEEAANPEDLKLRAPVVTVMGHVDHGKTSLLDAIRKSAVAAREAGGITQHIGAYSVKTDTGRHVTFIDTPGHEAFTAMRARGAKVTDIVVLVVAADDGVMPQTKEAANHALAAKVKIIVAVNKMDKPGADPEKIKKALTEFNLVPEEWGGETIYVPVSAKTGAGVPQLLEMIALQSDVMELKANPKKRGAGTVIEARLDKRRGPVITVLVQDGTLHEGDAIVVGAESGRIRAMQDDKGNRVREAGPATPIEIMGVSGVALAGDELIAVTDEKKAKEISELRQKIARGQDLSKSSKVSLDDLYQKIEQGDVKELKVIIKGDTTGSVEVLSDSLPKLSTPKVAVRVIHGGVGGISENDVMLATASGALIIGFNVRPEAAAANLAERKEVDIRLYDVIYHLTEDITKAMAGLLAPKKVEKRLGTAEVRQTFMIPKAGTVAGCAVTDGKILRSASVRLVRDAVPIYTGRLASLKRFKDDAREVPAGMECGLVIENYNDVKVGDVIESFQVEEIAATLD